MRSKRALAALVAAGVVGLSACGGGEAGETGADAPLRVGVIVPLSGTYASEGAEVRRGYEMALAAVDNQVAGRQVELVFGDAFAPEDAISETDRLATREDVDVFVGTYATPASQAGSEAAARNGLAWVETHAITDNLTERGLDSYIRVGPRAVDFAEASVQFVTEGLAEQLGPDLTVFVEHEDGPYGTSVAETQVAALEEAGLTVVQGQHSAAATDVTDSVLAASRAEPDVWLVTGYASDDALLLRTAAAQGFSPRATVLVGAGDTRAIYEAVGAEDLTDTFVLAYTSPVLNPEWAPGNADFYADYLAEYGSEPLGTVANTGFTGMTSFTRLLEAAEGQADVASLDAAAATVDVAEGELPNGWGLQLDEQLQNTRIRLLAVQWREDGTVPAVWPAEAVAEGQELVVASP